MDKYKIAGNHVLFSELDSDSLGTNYRAGVIKDKKVEKHCLLTQVYPDIARSPKAWRRVKVLIEGIKNQNIPGLYCPQEIIEEEERAMLVYPFINGKSFEALLADTAKSHSAMELELVFSIVFEIADALDNSSAIVINKKRSFHGVITPDNIFVDFDGKIYLRNYGIFPYLEDAPGLLTETIKKFKDMFAPEVLQNKELTVQSDIYHLGNIVYRLLTGEYFKESPGEDVEVRLAKIDLDEFIMLPEDSYGPKIVQLLKKTLNPDPSKRFVSIKEFKEYISKYFHIEELSSATFRLAYFMNMEYKKTMEEREKLFPQELAYSVPDIKPKTKAVRPIEKDKIDDAMIEDILIELEQQKRSRVRLIIPFVVILLVVLGVSGYLFITQQKEVQKQREAQLKQEEEFERRVAEMKSDLITEYQRRLKDIEDKTAATEEEKKVQTNQIEDLKQWKEEQERERLRLLEERQKALDKLEEEIQRRREEMRRAAQQKIPADTKPKEPVVAKKVDITPVEKTEITAPPAKTLNIGDTISLDTVTFAPSKLSGRRNFKSSDLKLSRTIMQKYQGQDLNVISDILINEFGSVAKTRIKGGLPEELNSEVSKILKTWSYIPAEKDKVQVKVWMPANVTISFSGTLPEEVKAQAVSPPIPLEATTYKPSKLSGRSKLDEDNLKLTRAMRSKYAGQTLNIKSSILINELGNVIDVKIEGKWPGEIKLKITEILETWTYTPAEKDKVKVKVWLPTDISVAFKGDTPPPVEIAAPTALLVPLSAVTYEPSKLSGKSDFTENSLKLSKSTRDQYEGQKLTVNADILIDGAGKVAGVKIKDDVAGEIKSKVTDVLETWTYTPAEKDKVKVSVWLPTDVTIAFKQVPKKVLIPIPDSLTPLKEVTYRPSKMSGSGKLKAGDLKLSGAVRKQYKGQTVNIPTMILINEVGSLIRAEVKGDWPDEIKEKLGDFLMKTWKYLPAEKNKVKVAVWLPVRISVTF